MNVRNTIALANLTCLAVAGVLQADEPIKVPPQQQPIPQVQQANRPATPWVEPSRRDRRLLQRQDLQNQSIVQAQPIQQPTPTPQQAAQQSQAATSQNSRLQPTPVAQLQFVEARRPGLLGRLFGRRSTIYYTPTAAISTAVSQPADAKSQALPSTLK